MEPTTNCEGLSFMEWWQAAGRDVPFKHAIKAWKRGEDPCDWRHAWGEPINPPLELFALRHVGGER
jgi:hypothetical protein